MIRTADLSKAHYRPEYPGFEDALALDLAASYEPQAFVVSWASQQRAQAFVNSHDLWDVLAELERGES